MSKAIIYMANTNSQPLTTSNLVNFGNIVHRQSCCIQSNGSSPVLSGQGYYEIDTNLTITPTTNGTVVVTMYENGVAIPGAVASFSGIADSIYTVSIPGITKIKCWCDKVITVTVTGVRATVGNAGIEVTKE